MTKRNYFNSIKYFNQLCPYYKFSENVINQEELAPLAKGLRLWVRLFLSAFHMYLCPLWIVFPERIPFFVMNFHSTYS